MTTFKSWVTGKDFSISTNIKFEENFFTLEVKTDKEIWSASGLIVSYNPFYRVLNVKDLSIMLLGKDSPAFIAVPHMNLSLETFFSKTGIPTLHYSRENIVDCNNVCDLNIYVLHNPKFVGEIYRFISLIDRCQLTIEFPYVNAPELVSSKRSVIFVFDRWQAINNNIQNFLLEYINEGKALPKEVFIDGSFSCSETEIEDPKPFPTLPIVNHKNDKVYHISLINKQSSPALYRQLDDLGMRFCNDRKMKKRVIETPESTFGVKVDLGFHVMPQSTVTIHCTIPSKDGVSKFFFGKIGFQLGEEGKSSVKTFLSGHNN